MKLRNIIATALLLTLGSCSTEDKTRYTIEYQIDNTQMQSDFLEVFELGTSKWRSNHHTLDTVMINGEMHEIASGTIKEVANKDCTSLSVMLEGYRPGIGGTYKLDTIFTLQPFEDNYFIINDSTRWLSSSEYNN